MNHLGLFEGIGGFSLAARWMGWNTVAWVEIDPFCQKVLKKNFPDAKGYGDIREFDGNAYKGKIDILTGGFPCQPFSAIGKRKGRNDERFLWGEMYRVIKEVKPAFIVGENVGELLRMEELGEILSDLEVSGYQIEIFSIPAYAVGAPHYRERVWITAYSKSKHGDSNRQRVRLQAYEKRDGGQFAASNSTAHLHEFPTTREVLSASEHFRNGYGIPNGMDRNYALGNAIVPHVAYNIFYSLSCV